MRKAVDRFTAVGSEAALAGIILAVLDQLWGQDSYGPECPEERSRKGCVPLRLRRYVWRMEAFQGLLGRISIDNGNLVQDALMSDSDYAKAMAKDFGIQEITEDHLAARVPLGRRELLSGRAAEPPAVAGAVAGCCACQGRRNHYDLHREACFSV